MTYPRTYPHTYPQKIVRIQHVEVLFSAAQMLKQEFISVKDIPCGVFLSKVKLSGVTGRRHSS
ncbi:MAG: hypothetical protein NVSMB33_05950 [Ktedonobacteraceae bacterium]